MNIIYITPYLPAFGSHGCATKTFNDIELLSLRHKINVFSFVSPQDKKKIETLQGMNCKVFPFFVKSYKYLPYKCREMTNAIRGLLTDGGADILQCECSFMTKYLPAFNNVPSVLTKHQIFPLYFWREFKVKRNPLMLLRIAKNIFNEKVWFSRFKEIVFLSEHDKEKLKSLIKNGSKTRVVPLGINLEYFRPYRDSQSKYDACFLGNFSNYPNVDAMVYFNKKILPLIRERFPDFSMLIIGANPPEVIRRFNGRKNVHVTGYVEDTRPYLAMSKILINPMRLGSGMRKKLLEAWAMAKPVVSTAIGCEGIKAIDAQNIFIADSPKAFSDEIKLLMEDKELRVNLGKAARATAEKYYDRKNIVSALEKLYLELVSS